MKKKITNLSVKSTIFIFSFGIIFLFLSSIAYSSTTNKNDTENIYSLLSCKYNKNKCEDKGSKLFTFYSKEADCPDISTQCSQIDCSNVNDVKCKQLQEKCQKEGCEDSTDYGKSGTLEMAKNLIIGGSKMFLLGFDKLGFHWFKIGIGEFDKNVIGFKENSKDIYFANDIIAKNNIYLQNNNSRITWGDSYINSNSGNINFISNNQNIANINNGGYQIKSGLKINGDLRTNSILWKGNTNVYRSLHWSPVLGNSTGYSSPSNENRSVLFYCDQVSGSGSCPN